ncbi:MAG: hydroxysqualene dehydroxylase HpnE [Eikenella sp.]|nr:hydroxysqualene dehydroxylase HpnE [Eikenella sp.]
MTRKPNIAVIGAGWAGLAAAEQLCGRAEVTVFEAGKTAGGRARALAVEDSGFARIDNGQHILIGAYRQVLALLARCGVAEADAFLRLPMQWQMHGGLSFAAANLPTPWHLLAGVLRAQKAGQGGRLALLRQMHALKSRTWPQDMSVAAWLRQQQVSRHLWQMFWQPLVWGAMNTDLEQASLRRLQNVLRDGVWYSKSGSDMLLPRQDLGSLLVTPVCRRLAKHGVRLRLQTRAGAPEIGLSGSLKLAGEAFDAVLIATAPYHAPALLPAGTPAEVHNAFARLRYHAITTVYLRYAQALPLPAPMAGLADGTAQWLIDRHALGLGRHEVSAVVSLSEQHGALSREQWIERVQQDVRRICPDAGEPLAGFAITEKRATVAASTDLPDIPQAWLRQQRIYLAGAYLHPSYPATLEAAVQSGKQAATLLMLDWARGQQAT